LSAEETLLREIENRYPAPDAVSPRHISASPGSSSGAAGASAGRQEGQQHGSVTVAPRRQEGQHQPQDSSDTVDFQPALAAAQSLTPVDSMESAEK